MALLYILPNNEGAMASLAPCFYVPARAFIDSLEIFIGEIEIVDVGLM